MNGETLIRIKWDHGGIDVMTLDAFCAARQDNVRASIDITDDIVMKLSDDECATWRGIVSVIDGTNAEWCEISVAADLFNAPDTNPDDPEMDDGTLVGGMKRTSGFKPIRPQLLTRWRETRDMYAGFNGENAREYEQYWNVVIALECHRAALWAWAEQN